MKTPLKTLSIPVIALTALLSTVFCVNAQTVKKPVSRINAPIRDDDRQTLTGTKTPRAKATRDLGAVDPSEPLQGISLDFSRSPEQEADLQALIAAQEDIHSPLYHQWLTPDEFGARFGASDEDITKTEAWLRGKGFTIENVARGRNHIAFSGTAAMVESAFGAPIHNFTGRDGKIHFAPANDLTIPSALAAGISYVRNLSSFLPHPLLKKALKPRSKNANPLFTDGSNSFYLLTPGDLAVQYDVNAAYQAGYTGAGQSIAVVGRSYVLPSDVATFQKLAGFPDAKPPMYILVPATGASYRSPGDESESDIDVEYSSTIGRGAQVILVYDGGNLSSDPFYAIQYAIDERIAPIITNSYGDCELDETSASITAFDAILAQGLAQGQTMFSAAGDDGAVDCIEDYPSENVTTVAQAVSLAVDYPASSPDMTGMGGTGFPTSVFTYPNTTYWNNSTGGVDVATTLKTPAPETVWNDDDPNYGTSAGGGGISLYETRPTWQAAGTMIGGTALPGAVAPSTKMLRLVPDLALFGSPDDPGMVICTSDPTAFFYPQTASCTDGFADAATGYYVVFGGTSFDAPIFAGMTAIINQALKSTGQGNINPTLYSLAANATTYPLAFHDITVGSNSCPASICGTAASNNSFSAGVGYDEASGLGSVDLMNLITAWPKPASAALATSTTAVTAASANPALSTADIFTIKVTEGTTTPGGTVALYVDGTLVNPTLGLISGVATYSFSSNILGTHVVTAVYSGDTTYAGSRGILQISVGTTSPGFTVTAANVTVTSGSTATPAVTVTPATGYTGAVNLTITGPTTLLNACYTTTPVTVIGTAAVQSTFTIYTNVNNCPVGAGALGRKSNQLTATNSQPTPRSPWQSKQLPVSLAGLVLLAGLARRKRFSAKLFLALLALGFVSIGLTGCTPSSSAVSSTAPPSYFTPTGVYTMTITGTDSSNHTLINSSTFTLTVQ